MDAAAQQQPLRQQQLAELAGLTVEPSQLQRLVQELAAPAQAQAGSSSICGSPCH